MTEGTLENVDDTAGFLLERLGFMPVVCSVMSAEMFVFLTLEEIVDGAVSTALFGNSSKLFLEEIVGGVGSNPSELFLADCLLENLGFLPADCSMMSALLSALSGKPSLVTSHL